MSNFTHYIVSGDYEEPDGSRHTDLHYLYDNREGAWDAICHVLKTYTTEKYAAFAPRSFHIYIFELNSSNRRHVILYWNEALNYALENRNPLP